MEYIPERISPGRSLEPSLWSAFGRAVASLHEQGLSPIAFGVPIDGALREVARWAEGLSIQTEVERILETVASTLGGGTTTVIHGEVNAANVARRSDGTVVLLDWDQAGDGATFIDHGYPLITQFVSIGTPTFHADAANAFYEGLRPKETLDPKQVFSAALLHALRYARFAETDLRWERIRWAIGNEEELCSALA